ncbi:Ubiquitin carboxyl-terminal hydrolase 16 [Acorus calamus]|uniref:ubiquitinyl hydrolase 1 n=1 Tax=Acorus calamus TaxID=4465 RepID=A0AAV9CEE8_ACOCL|nr:Ubiquitin carboxyl-terminal hydrolase 16 [Acorus calamus]
MPLAGLLSTGGAAALVCLALLAPVLLAVVRRRWTLAARRIEEVRRLLLVASEESERAEMESAHEYRSAVSAAAASATSASVFVQEKECAFCGSPATKLCSRCKSVRYCSGNCQISHWFQGHKDVCHSPSISSHYNTAERNSNLKASTKQVEQSVNSGVPVEGDDRDCVKPFGGFLEKPILQPRSSSNITNGVNDVKVEPLSVNMETKCNSGSSTVYKSSGYFKLADVSFDKVDVVNSPVRAVEFSSSEGSLSNSSTAEFGFPVSSVDAASVSNTSRQKLMSDGVGEVDCRTNGQSGLDIDGSGGRAFVVDYQDGGFWSASLDSPQSEFCKESNGFYADSGYVSQFSTRISGRSNDSYTKSRTDECSSGSASAEKVVIGPSRPKDVQDSDIGRSASGASGRMKIEQQLKSRGSRSLSFGTSADHFVSSDGGKSISTWLPLKLDDVQAASANISADKYPSQSGSHDLKTSVRRVAQQLVSQQFKIPKLSKNPSAFGSEINGKHNHKMLFQYDLFVKLYLDKVELRPCGLLNCGNSCYANVVLQCLAFTRPLTAYFLRRLHSKRCSKKEFCFLCEFESLVSKEKESKSPLSPIGILSQLHKIGGNLSQGKEEDAHEFLRHAIDAMQSVCLEEAGANVVGSLAEGSTLMQLTFGGYLRSKIKCMKCLGKSERHERMMDLTVEIDGDVGTLEEALRRYTATELLDGNNKYRCSRCQSYEKAKKKLTVLEAPNILTIALKRFQSGKFGKLNKAVQFPAILNLGPFMDIGARNDKSPVYSLYAVVVHLDVMNAAFSGHYVCYVKTSQNKWYKVDDSTVKPVELEKVLSQGAYMLLYARCSPRAPNMIGDLLSCDQFHNKKSTEATISSHRRSNSAVCSRPSTTTDTFGSLDVSSIQCARFPNRALPLVRALPYSAARTRGPAALRALEIRQALKTLLSRY